MSIIRFKEARNSLKQFKFRLTESHLTLSSTIINLAGDRLGQISPHHATHGQLSWQNFPPREDFTIEENMLSAGLFATAKARNSLKPFKFRLTESHLTPSSTITNQAGDRLGQISPHHATRRQLSWQNFPPREDFTIEENMSSAGLSAPTSRYSALSHTCNLNPHTVSVYRKRVAPSSSVHAFYIVKDVKCILARAPILHYPHKQWIIPHWNLP